MHSSLRAGFMLTALSAAAFAQSMLEHAMVTGPAAAGATTGALAGAKLGQILNQAGEQAGAAAKTGQPKTVEVKPAVAPAQNQATPAPPSSHFAADGPVAGSSGRSGVRPSGAQTPLALADRGNFALAQPAVPASKSFTQDELLAGVASIQPGAARAEVLEKLGAPSYKIAYDDGGA